MFFGKIYFMQLFLVKNFDILFLRNEWILLLNAVTEIVT